LRKDAQARRPEPGEPLMIPALPYQSRVAQPPSALSSTRYPTGARIEHPRVRPLTPQVTLHRRWSMVEGTLLRLSALLLLIGLSLSTVAPSRSSQTPQPMTRCWPT